MPARATPFAAGARPFWGVGLWLALVAVALQAPSISVRHCHAGGWDDHHHASCTVGGQPVAQTQSAGDLAQAHGHRVVWGWDLHDPSDQDSDGDRGDDQPPAGVIQASLAPSEEIQPRQTACIPFFSVSAPAPRWAPQEKISQPRGFQMPAGSHSGPMVLRV